MTANPFERFPRVELGHWPTPLEPLDRLSAELCGPRIWVKRDDCSGLALGGNKVRKLEYLIADALDQGADTVLTTGAVQSNHARQTAAAAARAGLACELILPRLVTSSDATSETGGNVLLDSLLGANVHLVDDVEAAVYKIREVLDAVEARGGKAVFIPAGGSTEIGALGFARAALELTAQLDELGLSIDQIVLACSSGGTQAGLASGLALLGREIDVTGICVYADEAATRETVTALVEATCARLEIQAPPAQRYPVIGDYLGGGYGEPTRATTDAIKLVARLEGLLLDPVYTGKAMGGLIDLIRKRELAPDTDVVFWHTGGGFAAFSHDFSRTAAADARRA